MPPLPAPTVVFTPDPHELAAALGGAASRMLPAIRTQGARPTLHYRPITGETGVDPSGGPALSGWVYSRQRISHTRDLADACAAAGREIYAQAERQHGRAHRYTLNSCEHPGAGVTQSGTVYATDPGTAVDTPRHTGRLLRAALSASGVTPDDGHALTYEHTGRDCLAVAGFRVAGAPAWCDFHRVD